MTDTKSFNEQIIEEFRANDGKVGGQFEGAPMLLLTVTGAKTGRRLTSPLVYTRDGDRFVIIASNGGADKNPNWYTNLLADPAVTVEVGAETFEAKATAHAEGPERDRLFASQADQIPGFWEYTKKTDRVIPVVTLERTS
ncbi:nitroreductase family deazaflavin-dependent oxidoreductase [Phytoactinopolyspora halotolerans]|uniref:Nitroreductase family deazaflavin-dependent oxidoreductase n=1 Tax=Phytoactinopolyspora halotolerans TaxID=1981512 RepID=A0A6L9SFW7_9ACTN|nr:nitroreductase family deazaflavin-dependent oxidoreductase [Phytoactinopolyspora halotolerans]NEE03538.1 nitroreductase family deazaflavin-dependent oxidoreductase [Phytoactinopolyspora halotolerans]